MFKTPRSSCIRRIIPWSFLTPSLIGTFVFYFAPLLETIAWSFSNAKRSRFVGFSNYISVLHNQAFQLAVKNTLRFLIICLPILLVSSLIFAWILWLLLPHSQRLQALFLLPPALPVAGVVLTWKIIFGDAGLLNTCLNHFNLPTFSFLQSDLSFWVLVATFIWKNLGYILLIWMAGLCNIPYSLYEAASIDGANLCKAFYYITLPSLPPFLGLAALFGMIECFKVFREAWLLAGNYPPDCIYLLPHLLNNWFLSLDMQRVCAAAILLLSFIGVGIAIYHVLLFIYRRHFNSDVKNL